MRRTAGLGVLVIGLCLCPLAARAQTSSICTPTAKNIFVRDVMTDIYLWAEHVPVLDPARYPSPEAYLQALRYLPLDASFSYVADRAATEALFSSSQYAGFGFSSLFDEGGRLRLAQVFPGGPAEDVGLIRGDRILEVNGRSVETLLASGEFGDAYGPAEAGVSRVVLVARGDESFPVTMTKRPVTIPTVSHTRVLDVGGRRVGYLFFRNFVEPSFEALDAAFAELLAGGVTELILDLRYNGGGLVDVAQHLGGLIGGARTVGQVFAEYSHNGRNAFRNRAIRFEVKPQALTLDRVIAITSRASASASELVINALRPFIPVVTVGDRTYGKPVGQYAIPFCDKMLAPVSFSLRNADGEGDFFDGLPATCVAPDDVNAQLGDPAEGSLHEALVVVSTGACSPPPAAVDEPTFQPARQRHMAAPRPVGWDAVLGAH